MGQLMHVSHAKGTKIYADWRWEELCTQLRPGGFAHCLALTLEEYKNARAVLACAGLDWNEKRKVEEALAKRLEEIMEHL